MTSLALATPQPARHPSPTAKAVSLDYLIVGRPDLDRAERFLNDFGLRTVEKTESAVFLRACNDKPWCYQVIKTEEPVFIATGFSVSSERELEALAAIAGSSAIEPISAPGGGKRVRMTDPNGFHVDAVLGREPSPAIDLRQPLTQNVGDQVTRINATQRPPTAAADILKLGHVVFETADFQAVCGFYTEHFGFIPSDTQVLPDGSPAVTFMRMDLGDTPADHHTLALAQTFRGAYSHSAYEVIDVDGIGMGQQYLQNKGWQHAWGMGRHILGSQIFDYWSDPWGAHHEHYCDGDVFTADHPTGIHPFSGDAMAQWGQVMPASFIKPPLNWTTIKTLIRNLRTVPDLTLKKLMTIAKLAS